MPLLETKGAGSAQGFGLSLGGEEAVYVEDVFSTYLYTGNSSTQTITNGIDLAGEGGLVWVKARSGAFAQSHWLTDTVRGAGQALRTDTTNASVDVQSDFNQTFLSSGFSFNATSSAVNNSGYTYASWTFRKQPKFFDVVTYTGDGSNRTIAHNLGSVPGCIIVKKTSGADNWFVQHRSLGATKYIALNDADIAYTNSQIWNNTEPTSTVFTLGTNSGVNQSGATYVAYLFAHNAGGFGLTGTDNVISCGSYTGNGSATGPVITLGYEPQWVMFKRATVDGGDWAIFDNMRGITTGAGDPQLLANLPNAEAPSPGPYEYLQVNATGFQPMRNNGNTNGSGETYIYIAIRRGPMKVPTSGTEVFSPIARTGNSPTVTSITSPGFAPDAVWQKRRSPDTAASNFFDKLRGRFFLSSATTSAETAANTTATRDLVSFDNLGFTVGEQWSSELNANTKPEVYWSFRRAPGFFDVVCYTGTNTLRTVNHNLGVPPELVIIKIRNSTDNWEVWTSYTSMSSWYRLNENTFSFTPNYFNSVSPTSTEFTLKASGVFAVNQTGYNYVAYLFATVAGVSKVGSYTGSGTTKQIDCGFTAGARFVLIKRTDSTGDWYVWDSARGIVAGNDPYLLLNSTAAEVTSTDYIDTASTGFEISSTAPAAINASGGSYIFLAIA